MDTGQTVVPVERIEKDILFIRGQKVMISVDLAKLYGVETRVLNQAVKRNIERFPADFIFQLKNTEAEFLVSQNVIPNKKLLGGHLPYAFTEQGVAMLSSVLNSDRAIQVNITIMRAFVKLRETLSTHKELVIKFDELENKIEKHDKSIKAIFEAIRQLMQPAEKKRIPIGFTSNKQK